MTYPKLLVKRDIVLKNVKALKKLTSENEVGILYGVTKVFCADPELAKIYIEGGVDGLADSRIQNLKKLQNFDIDKILLRLPQHSEVDEVVRYADISLNSEISTLRKLNEAAAKAGCRHKAILMVDLGDLREGFFQEEDFYQAVEEVLKMDHLILEGIGTNLTCYGAVIPKPHILKRLDDYKQGVKDRFDYDLKVVSGGNSSSVYLLGKEKLPSINNLRLGETLIRGTESSYGKQLPGTNSKGWVLQAQIIEIKEKPSVPVEETGLDAFGHEPVFVDRGVRKRALIAIGKQDIVNESLYPVDKDMIVLGGSSDHTILDISDCQKDYQVGDIVEFNLDYVGVLMTCTSEYVDVEII
ncbi:alanine/ornithine racemase family PLP-dependent enzyme [Urinicoccus timonensis]|uniref:alanine/ornithine racemase family PLP-dependent enzyme n=1 Tax=Urinicoccus timonensis TaxID=2024205 RepID=UPI000C0692CF|nr:alanine/ornithine racemase family PLP-dependent enzyme [Urinicoccus timonensis]